MSTRLRRRAAVMAALLLSGASFACRQSRELSSSATEPDPAAASLLRAAREHEAASRPVEALAAYERALSVQPELIEVRVHAAELARRTGSPADAVRHAEHAVKQSRNHRGARIVLARALAAESPRKATALLKPVLAGTPDDAAANVAAGEIALAADDPGTAMGRFRAALRADADELLLDVARGMSRAGFHQDALETVQRALEQEDHSPDARYTLAWVLENAERYQECVEEYSSLLQDHPGHLPAYRNLGALMARDGELPSAIRLWERGLEYHPGDPGLRANVEEALDALGLALEGGQG